MSQDRPPPGPDAAIEAAFAAYLEHLEDGGDSEQFLAQHPNEASVLRDLLEFQEELRLELEPPSSDAMAQARQQLHARLRMHRLKHLLGRFPFRRPRLWLIAGSLGIGMSLSVAFAQEPGRVIQPFSAVVENLPLTTGSHGPASTFDQLLPMIPTPEAMAHTEIATPTPQPRSTKATPAAEATSGATVTPAPGFRWRLANTGAAEQASPTPSTRSRGTPSEDGEAPLPEFEVDTPAHVTSTPGASGEPGTPAPRPSSTPARPTTPVPATAPAGTPLPRTPSPATPQPTTVITATPPVLTATPAPTESATEAPTQVVTPTPWPTQEKEFGTPTPTIDPIVVETPFPAPTNGVGQPSCLDEAESPGTPGSGRPGNTPTPDKSATPCPDRTATPTPTPLVPLVPQPGDDTELPEGTETPPDDSKPVEKPEPEEPEEPGEDSELPTIDAPPPPSPEDGEPPKPKPELPPDGTEPRPEATEEPTPKPEPPPGDEEPAPPIEPGDEQNEQPDETEEPVRPPLRPADTGDTGDSSEPEACTEPGTEEATTSLVVEGATRPELPACRLEEPSG